MEISDNGYGLINLEKIHMEYEEKIRKLADEGKLPLASAAPLGFVYGYGPEDADVVMIGEAPGKDEVKLGRPFVGKAGAILDEILNATGIKRERLYITNTVKYRLMKEGSRKGSYRNRPAALAEVKAMLPWLEEELKIIKPKMILTLGNVPLKALCFIQNCAILELGVSHGKGIKLNIFDAESLLVPLYHPASQIYNRSLKDVFDDDFREVKRLLREI